MVNTPDLNSFTDIPSSSLYLVRFFNLGGIGMSDWRGLGHHSVKSCSYADRINTLHHKQMRKVDSVCARSCICCQCVSGVRICGSIWSTFSQNVHAP